MDKNKSDELFRGCRRVVFLAVVPTILFMVYAAMSGLEIHSTSRGWNPQTSTAATWAKTPVKFLFNGIMVYVSFAFVMLCLYIFGMLARKLLSKNK